MNLKNRDLHNTWSNQKCDFIRKFIYTIFFLIFLIFIQLLLCELGAPKGVKLSSTVICRSIFFAQEYLVLFCLNTCSYLQWPLKLLPKILCHFWPFLTIFEKKFVESQICTFFAVNFAILHFILFLWQKTKKSQIHCYFMINFAISQNIQILWKKKLKNC